MQDKYVKNAGIGGDFLQGFLGEAVRKVNFKEKPFETIFHFLGPAILWQISKPLGILSGVVELFGYGPGYIGKLIDQHLLRGKSLDDADLSESSLKGASDSVVSDISKQYSQTSTASILTEMCLVKNSFTHDDILVAGYINKYSGFNKEAIGFGSSIISKLFGMSGFFTGAIYWLLKKIVGGLALMGVLGGAASALKLKDYKKEPEYKEKEFESKYGNLKYYPNVSNNVEDTIIKFLDATIKDFSSSFEQVYKAPLKGSSQMKDVLYMIEDLNNDTLIKYIDSWDKFVAPEVLFIAKTLIPIATFNKIKEQPEKTINKSKYIKKPETSVKEELAKLVGG